MKTTNIYYLIDCSAFMGNKEKENVRQIIKQMKRALRFSNTKTQIHLLGYNDKAFLLDTDRHFPSKGNANLTEGLKLLETVIRYQRKYNGNQTKSVFLWYTSGKSLIGYEKQLERLFSQKEFAFGLRYTIIQHFPTIAERKRLEKFTENADRVLNYFSAKRLMSLVGNIV